MSLAFKIRLSGINKIIHARDLSNGELECLDWRTTYLGDNIWLPHLHKLIEISRRQVQSRVAQWIAGLVRAASGS